MASCPQGRTAGAVVTASDDTPRRPPAVPHTDGNPWPWAARTTDARHEALEETVL
jgi:hypothetical protein